MSTVSAGRLYSLPLDTHRGVLVDPVSERETSMIKKYIRQLLSQPEDKHPDGILLILTLLKSKHCRITFITEMVKVSATKPLFYTTFMVRPFVVRPGASQYA